MFLFVCASPGVRPYLSVKLTTYRYFPLALY